MASSAQRKKARKRRKQRVQSGAPIMDGHGEVVLNSLDAVERLVRRFAGRENPFEDIDAEFQGAVEEFVTGLNNFDPIRLIEVARITYLPMTPRGTVVVTPDAVAAHVELLTLVALAAAKVRDGGTLEPVEFQAMSKFTSEARGRLEELLQLAQMRAIASADPANKLTMVELLLRGSMVWMRNSSYPAMAQKTLVELFDTDPDVHAILLDELGFDATTALAVLEGCHKLQETALNNRMFAMVEAMNNAMASVNGDQTLNPDIREATNAKLMFALEPDAEGSTVNVQDLASHTGVDAETIAKVVKQFRVDLGEMTPSEVVDGFMSGNNPLRTRPIIVADDGRVMLPHHALTADAVKENLEGHLKLTQASWSKYDLHRGKTLERRTTAALNRVLPGATHRDGLEYYVPANDEELNSGDSGTYTKRVEGDHLVLLDDVAFIVEDKAVALSALSKGGKTNRIRTDLTNIVTKAAEQSGRLREAIQRDGGVRIHGEGWVDLSHIREIHTIAVSLDDLTSISTATAELVRAGLLDYDNIPWTVSIHDLELIVELIERPAQFLLFLRRRLNLDATVMFSAPDELDLFLFFFEDGLWVEPDPYQVRAAFPFLPPPTSGEVRRYREQVPVLITSRTDPLDLWFYTKDSTEPGSTPAPKPTMVASPLADLIDELQARGTLGWLSIGATLLENATSMQHKLANIPRDMLNQPTQGPHGRSQTIPITSSVKRADGWLLVWATRHVGTDPEKVKTSLGEYLRTKKHQLALPRGALFLYDEGTRELVDVLYDGHIGELDAELSAKLSYLKPPSALQNRLHPNAKKTPTAAASATVPRPKPKSKRKPRPKRQPKSKRKR